MVTSVCAYSIRRTFFAVSSKWPIEPEAGITYRIVSDITLVEFVARECFTWWRHQMETFSALLAFCAGNSPVPGEFPTQRPVTRSFEVLFHLRPNKRLSKQSWGWWSETPSSSLWRPRNELPGSSWPSIMALMPLRLPAVILTNTGLP